MAYYSEGGYGAEEVKRPYVGNPGGYFGGEGGERYAVRKDYEEVDEVARARVGHGHHHGGHLGHGGGGSYRYGHAGHEGYHEHLGGGHREHLTYGQYGHGHDGGRHYDYDARESKYDPGTGQYYA